MLNYYGTVEMAGCAVTGNSACRGGDIANHIRSSNSDVFLTVGDCTIADNTAVIGGGIYNFAYGARSTATTMIDSSIICDNSASDMGGGITNVVL